MIRNVGQWVDVRNLYDESKEFGTAPIGTVVTDVFGRHFFLRKSSPGGDRKHWSSDNTSYANISGGDRVKIAYWPGEPPEPSCNIREHEDDLRLLDSVRKLLK